MSANSASSIVRFGRFEVNFQSGELRHAGQKVKLQEQPFQVLATLLERPGEVVTRDELRSRLWPGDTFVDFDTGLNTAIKRLRDALGESADVPVFIETLARRGYRFIAPVNGSSSPSAAEIEAQQRNKSISSTRRIVVFCLAPLVIAVVLWTAWRRVPSRRTDIIERKLTSNSSENSVSSASISPDGKYLAYADNTGIYLKQIRTGETHPVPLPPNFSAHVDDWFPDGRLVYALAGHDSSLWIVSLQQSGKISEPPKRIAQGNGWVRQVTGSADGKALTFLRENWSPSIYIGTLAADGTRLLAKRRLTLDESVNTPFSWTPDSKAVLFNSDRNGTSEIFKQATDQPLAENLMTGAENLSGPRLTT